MNRFCASCGGHLVPLQNFCPACGVAALPIPSGPPLTSTIGEFSTTSVGGSAQQAVGNAPLGAYLTPSVLIVPPNPPPRPMTFGQAMQFCFKNYANFKGRASRSEFWFFYLFVIIVTIGGYFLIGILSFLSPELGVLGVLLQLGVSFGFFIPLLATAVRRLHDTGKSGGLSALYLIPCAGFIILAIFNSQAGQSFDNQYGPAR